MVVLISICIAVVLLVLSTIYFDPHVSFKNPPDPTKEWAMVNDNVLDRQIFSETRMVMAKYVNAKNDPMLKIAASAEYPICDFESHGKTYEMFLVTKLKEEEATDVSTEGK